MRAQGRAVSGAPAAGIGACVLAAGASRRMGRPKLLLPFPAETEAVTEMWPNYATGGNDNGAELRKRGSSGGDGVEFREQGGLNGDGVESGKRGNSGSSYGDGWRQPVAARDSQRRSIGREGARSDGLQRRTRTRSRHGGGSDAVGTRAWHLPRPRARPNRQPTALATGMAPRSHPLAPEQPQAAHGSAPNRHTGGWLPDRRAAPGAAQRILRQGSPYAADFGAAA